MNFIVVPGFLADRGTSDSHNIRAGEECSSTITSTSDALSSAAVKVTTVGNPSHETENELRYFIPRERLALIPQNQKARNIWIAQHLIPEDSFSNVRSHLSSPQEIALFENFEVKRARLRHVFSAGEHRFYLQTKSSKKAMQELKISRDEASLEITLDLYKVFYPLASGGTIFKKRTAFVGEVFLTDGVKAPIELHIDNLLAAGRREGRRLPELIPKKKIPGVVVEIEFFGGKDQLQELLNGRHSFASLVQGCALIPEQSKSIRKALSNTKLAEGGFTSSTSMAMHLLLASHN